MKRNVDIPIIRYLILIQSVESIAYFCSIYELKIKFGIDCNLINKMSG